MGSREGLCMTSDDFEELLSKNSVRNLITLVTGELRQSTNDG